MTSKRILLILVSILASIGGKLAYDALFEESEIVSFESLDWRHRNYIGVEFEAPFELSEVDLELPVHIKPFVQTLATYKYDSKSLSLFISRAEYKEGISTDLNGAVQGATQNMKANDDITDFSFEVKPFSRNFLEGRLVNGTFKVKEKDAEFVAEFYKNGSKLMQILCVNLKYDENREARERIMKSLNVTL